MSYVSIQIMNLNIIHYHKTQQEPEKSVESKLLKYRDYRLSDIQKIKDGGTDGKQAHEK